MSNAIDREGLIYWLQLREIEFRYNEITEANNGCHAGETYWNGRKESIIDIINKIERGDYDKAEN